MVKLVDNLGSRFVAWAEVQRDLKLMAEKLVAEGPWAGIVAITRGGLVPAAILARELDIRLVDTLCITSYDGQVQEEAHLLKRPAKELIGDGAGWLVAEDVVDTGTTLRLARQLLPQGRFVALYAKHGSEDLVDLHVHEVARDVWVFFPWDTDLRYVRPIADPEEG